jgi:DNA-binding IclR family transcriptional regulator
VSSIRRAIEVMDLLAGKGALSARAVAQQLALPLGSVHRLLVDLEAEDVVERADSGAFQLSYRLLAITDRQLDGVKLPRLARPFCETIAEATGETVNVNVLSGATCVCIDKVRGAKGLQLDWPIGTRAPLYCGGSAKAILAFMDDAARERVLAQPRTQFTPFTLTGDAALRTELAAIRSRGFAIDNQEMVLGIFCVGVPIVDRHGTAVGAISITGPSPKSVASVAPLVAQLDDAAGKISRGLGYTRTFPPQAADLALADAS